MQPNPKSNPMLDAALNYAALGISVFPLQPRDKRPLWSALPVATEDRQGNHFPTGRRVWWPYQVKAASPSQITKWYTSFPTANIALVMGAVSGNKLAIDIDLKYNGSLDTLVQAFGTEVLNTWIQATGGGGYHLVYQLPEGVTIGNLKFGDEYPGIETRGEGGYIVGAPGGHPSGGEYLKLTRPETIGMIPGNLLDYVRTLITPLHPLRPAADTSVDDMGSDTYSTKTDAPVGVQRRTAGNEAAYIAAGASKYGAAALAREVERLSSTGEGKRNKQTFSSAAAVFELINGGEIPPSLGYGELQAAAAQTGIPDAEIKTTLASAARRTSNSKRKAAPKPAYKPKARSNAAPLERYGGIPNFEGEAEGEEAAREDNEAGDSTTELSNARRLVAQFGNIIRYVADWEAWVIWNGRFWKPDKSGQIYRLIQKVHRSIYAESGEAKSILERERLSKWAVRCEASAKIEATERLARFQEELVAAPTDFDNADFLLTVGNGTLDLLTGELREPRQSDMLTKAIDTDFYPDATCPKWDEFLQSATYNDIELIRFLQRWIGYCLTGDQSEHRFAFFHGNGGNGKSTFLKIIEILMGSYAERPGASLILANAKGRGIDTDKAMLKGARFALADEIDHDAKLADGKVKDITGGDSITASFLYSNPFTFQPTHHLNMYGNYEPKLPGNDGGLARRLLKIQFTYTPAKPDTHLLQKLKGELEGILVWAVRGCLLWQQIGLNPPAVVLAATKTYLAEQDQIGRFIDEDCLIDLDANLNNAPHTGASKLYNAYTLWARANNEKAETSTAFGKYIFARFGFSEDNKRKRRSKYGFEYVGIGLQVNRFDESEGSDYV